MTLARLVAREACRLAPLGRVKAV